MSVSTQIDPEDPNYWFCISIDGHGRFWFDSVAIEPFNSAHDLVNRFDDSSRFNLRNPTESDINRLAILGKVWGFLKYHHPAITEGQLHWDYELFHILSQVLSAPDYEEFTFVLTNWIRSIDSLVPADSLSQLDGPLPRWLADNSLGSDLSAALVSVARRPRSLTSYYVGHTGLIGAPVFGAEELYLNQTEPDSGFLLLALFRLWNIVENWYPYRSLISDWDQVLMAEIPNALAVRDRNSYIRTMQRVLSRLNDGHALLRPPAMRDVWGACRLPLRITVRESKPLVTFVAEPWENMVKVGDVIVSIDGVPVEEIIKQAENLVSAGNLTTRSLRAAVPSLTRGMCQEAVLVLHGAEGIKRVEMQRTPNLSLPPPPARPAFQLLRPELAYIDASQVDEELGDQLWALIKEVDQVIFDLRGYPGGFDPIDQLASHLVSDTTIFAQPTRATAENPGVFFDRSQPQTIDPSDPLITAELIVLIGPQTQSRGEFVAMAFQSITGVTLMGETSAAGNGNTVTIPLPGGIEAQLTGTGVAYPDGLLVQESGVVPDQTVSPTILGLREGRDEVLEAAVRHLLGKTVTESEIRRLTSFR